MVFQSHDEFVELKNSLGHQKNPETKKQQTLELERRLKSRQIVTGAFKLIAELFNVGFMNRKIQELCMQTLLRSSKSPTELDIECFHILITSIGAKIEEDPSGVALIEQYLGTLEDIIDRCGETYCMRIRYMILDIFELRARKWLPKTDEVTPDPQAESPQNLANSELIEKTKTTPTFLKELQDVLGHVEDDKLFIIMLQLAERVYDSEDQLEGAAELIFEHALEDNEFSLLHAFVCKGLAQVSSQNNRTVTFKSLLMSLCQREIEMQRKCATVFRQLHEQVRDWKAERNANKALKIKAAFEYNLKIHSRAHHVARFFGKLFAVDFIESRFIIEFLANLVSPEVISDTSIESFCLLMKNVAPKMLTEKNHDFLIMNNIAKLIEVSKTIELSQRAFSLIDDVTRWARIQLQLPVDKTTIQNVEVVHSFKSSWSQEVLWDAPLKSKLTQSDETNEEDKFASEMFPTFYPKPPPGYPPIPLDNFSHTPSGFPLPPRNWIHQSTFDEAAIVVHQNQNLVAQMENRKMMNYADDENNNVDFKKG